MHKMVVHTVVGLGVVHTVVGLGVDSATKAQLECLVRATGDCYFPAGSAQELADILLAAAQTSQSRQLLRKGYGLLKIKGADLAGHQVTKAEGGEMVATLSHTPRIR